MRHPLALPTNELTVGNRRLQHFVEVDSESAEQLRRLLTNAIASMLRVGLNHSDAARIQWQTAAQRYRERWAQGDLDGILPVLSDLLAWLQKSGVDPANNADVVALFNDPGFARILGRIPPIEPEANLLDMFRRLVGALIEAADEQDRLDATSGDAGEHGTVPTVWGAISQPTVCPAAGLAARGW